jgi:hypothetical protein
MDKTIPMITRMGTKARTGTMMIMGETTEIHHNMTTEMKIATRATANVMTSPLPNSRNGAETGS